MLRYQSKNLLSGLLVAGLLILGACAKKEATESAAPSDESFTSASDSAAPPANGQETEAPTESVPSANTSPDAKGTNLAFQNAGLKLEKSARLVATCVAPVAVTSQVEAITVANHGYVLSSSITKAVDESQSGPIAEGDSVMTVTKQRLRADIVLAVPNAEFEATMTSLGGLPIKVEVRNITQRDQAQEIEEQAQRAALDRKQAADADQDLARVKGSGDKTDLLDAKRASETSALSHQLDLQRLDRKVQWSIITIEVAGDPEIIIQKSPEIAAILRAKTNGGGSWTGTSGGYFWSVVLVAIGGIIGFFIGKRRKA